MSARALRWSLLAALLAGVVPLAPAAPEPAKAPPGKEQIDNWIKQLGSDDFEKREEATKKLWETGRPAEAALKEALTHRDAEVQRRARELLDKFKWGIYPDTPPKVVQLVTAYQTGDPNAKATIIRDLFETGAPGCRALLKIMDSETNADVRRNLTALVSAEMPRAVPLLLAENNLETLEALLDISLKSDAKSAVPNYTAYWLLRGKLDARVEEFEKQTAADSKRQQEILAYLHRVRGDLKAARAAAEKAGRPDLLEELLYEAGDWKELAQRYGAGGDGKEIEKLGFAVAYHRLAGDAKGFDAAVAALVKHAEDAPPNEQQSRAFYCARALFLNDRPEEALKLLTRGGQDAMAFEILAVRLKFGAAFELLERVRKESPEAPLVEVLAARTLYSLGEKDRARASFAKLAAEIKQGNDFSWFEELIDAEVRVGLRDDAFDHSARILALSPDMGWQGRLFGKLFPDKSSAAEVWWAYLSAKEPGEERTKLAAKNMKRLRELMEGRVAEKEFAELLDDAEMTARNGNAQELDRWLLALAETALAYRLDARALKLLEAASSAVAQQRRGDLLAEKKQWDRAAEAYRKAWEKDRHQPLPLFLCGNALTHAGKEAEGKKLLEQSHWIPLGDEAARHAFANALTQRGYSDASRRENELLLRVSTPASYYAGEALRRMAFDDLAKKEYLKAADGQEKSMLRCLRSYVSFVQRPAYLGVPANVHRLRARGLLDAGKFDEAQRETALVRSALPGDVELATLLVPELEKRGHKKEAAELFEGTQAVYEKLCKEYPRCAWAHNSAAWLAACCRRDLDKAKAHAEEAVKLAPTNAGHHDTLAEIYFQLGDREKAVATQRKAIELDPKKAYFRKQLKRIEAGDPKAERPPENDGEE